MRKTIGILAHVDSGKTTFSEQLLYHGGTLRSPGRIERGDTLLDSDEIERARGITIFSGQSAFEYGDSTYYLVDTPGHGDFMAETERAILTLDYAVMLLDATSPMQAHAITLFRLLERCQVPVLFFFNKTDLNTADANRLLEEVKARLTEDAVMLEGLEELEGEGAAGEALAEFVAERDEEAMEQYIDGAVARSSAAEALVRLVRQRKAFPCMKGSALKDEGVEAFMKVMDRLTVTRYELAEQEDFVGRVYKILHDGRGQRVAMIKALRGRLSVKDELRCNQLLEPEKVNEIRSYSGGRYTAWQEGAAGSLFGVTGLRTASCGDVVWSGAFPYLEAIRSGMEPVLEAEISPADPADRHRLMEVLRILEDEEPQLNVDCRGASEAVDKGADWQICICVMGEVQLEVISQIIKNRFGIEVSCSLPKILYQETVRTPVMGYGHYEPLRHYAEVNLRLEPGARGSGITFASECHVDVLAANFQSLVRTHVFERVHRGVLTGSPLTDVKIVLVAGRSHLKHTEGGDFREAVYRAIRQGLEQADSLLLEPWYEFEITADRAYAGRILSDIRMRCGEAQPPVIKGEWMTVTGRGPVSTFMDFGPKLKALTHGGGGISFAGGGYEPCHNPEEVIRRISYDKGADKENPSSSVFCSHGAGFVVNWDEAESYMHCIRR